jgi:hypothetical protein
MRKYLLIEPRDPFEGDEIREIYELSEKLSQAGNRVCLLLVQEGVRAARAGEHTFWFAKMRRGGVEILADEPSLRAQGVALGRLSQWVRPVEPAGAARLVSDGFEALWITDRPILRGGGETGGDATTRLAS